MSSVPIVIGKYGIQGVLGKGAMGTVYKAYDGAIARTVAIKAITKSTLNADELKHVLGRFRHEAQAVGRINHPRIVQIYDYGEDDNIAYIVMEYIEGKTLAQHLAQEVHYDVREAGEIIRQLLDGLGHAHVQNVIHRDVKPSNILINSDGRIKISDFGIARIEASDLTQAGDVLGTPHYMAPEQFLGGDVDALADLYSVGVISYELLTGRKPFTGNTAVIMQQVLNEPPVSPSKLNPKLAPLLDRVLHKALAKKAPDRFQNAKEFADALREAIEASVALEQEPAPAPASALDSRALLHAARLLNAGAAQPAQLADEVVASLTGDSAITLDTGVRKARVLFVDDEERILSALKSLFKARYHVFTTTDGNKALDFISKYHVHVIVSDQRMPAMPGVELLRRSREPSPRSVRILLTGYSDLAAIIGSINEGEVYRFISKPWDNTELQTIVAEAATIALEIADTKTDDQTLPGHIEAGVLVVEKNEDLVRVVRELVGELCPVVHARTSAEALAAVKSREIALVIADIEPGRDPVADMLKALKAENPQILAMVVTAASDSEQVIELINRAQIFRFLNKPVNVKVLKGHIHAAQQRYLTYRKAPQLVDEHRVKPLPRIADMPDTASTAGEEEASLSDRIRNHIRKWLGPQ